MDVNWAYADAKAIIIIRPVNTKIRVRVTHF